VRPRAPAQCSTSFLAWQGTGGDNAVAALAGLAATAGVSYRRLKRSALLPLLIPLVTACSTPAAGNTSSSPVAALAATPKPTPTPTPPQLSLASIFGSEKPDLSKYDASQLRVIIATGDVIPAREVNYQTVLHHDWL